MSGKRGSRDAVGDESAAASKRLCHSVGPAENSVEARATAVTLVQSLRRQLREAETALDALIPNALGAVDDGSARDDGNAAHDDGGSADGGDSAARDDDAADDDADGAARGADDAARNDDSFASVYQNGPSERRSCRWTTLTQPATSDTPVTRSTSSSPVFFTRKNPLTPLFLYIDLPPADLVSSGKAN
jgi:hypothetical protein